MRSIPLLFLTLAACGASEGKSTTVAQQPAQPSAASAHTDTASKSASAKPDTLAHAFADDSQIVRALYVNRWASQSPKRMQEMIAIADSTEINAFVIDMKDEFGLNFESADTMVKRNAGNSGKVPHLKELLDTLKAHHILAIARMVTFKDSVAARNNPQHVIRKPDG
ncbi:MAG TPA: putative glycoside hydrolase, partial [Gemmatimonadaceae bacterium]|nr:putative glycoside hydrolase [Gemmatimonadaceae bacterium]